MTDQLYAILPGKGVKLGRKTGAIVGCDFAGTVEEIGTGVPPGIRTIGERVAGFVRTGD